METRRLLACAAVALSLSAPAAPAGADNVASRLSLISAAGELKVCIWPYYGISFENPTSGSVTGVDADLAREPAHEPGARLVDQFVAAVRSDGRLLRIAGCYGLDPIVVAE